jgi:hypothetical protein
LTKLAPYLPEELIAEALEAARGIGDEYDRARALSGLAEHLPEGERQDALGEALEAARGIGDEYVRAIALSGLAEHLPESISSQFWTAFDHDLATTKRNSIGMFADSSILKSYVRLGVIASQWGGDDVLRETLRAIRDTAEWWP